jgi:hypothetical protein
VDLIAHRQVYKVRLFSHPPFLCLILAAAGMADNWELTTEAVSSTGITPDPLPPSLSPVAIEQVINSPFLKRQDGGTT